MTFNNAYIASEDPFDKVNRNQHLIKTPKIVDIKVERVKNKDFEPFLGPRLADKGILYAHLSSDTSLYAF